MLSFDRNPSFRQLLALFACLPLLALVVACAPSEDGADLDETEIPSAEVLASLEEAARVIDEDTLRGHVATLSADDFGGRGPGTEGDEKTQQYLVEQMEAIGLEPGAGEGEWLQPFDIVGVDATVPETWTFTADGSSLTLEHDAEFVAFSGVQEESAAIEDAELVFVGYGIEAPEYEWDDYGDAELEGKVLVMLNNDPEWDPELFEGERRLYYGRWDYKYAKAAEMGAVGAIIHHTRPSAGYPFGVVQSSWSGPQFQLPAGDEPRLQVGAWTVEDATRELVALGGFELDELIEQARSKDFRPVPLGITTSLALDNEIQRTETANVIGKLAGSDPDLADEVVIYGAHHDHLGTGEPDEDGDRIYNGALDNAAGTSMELAVAKAMQELPRNPRRSVLFAFWAAEEQGLLGSEYFAAHPPVPPGKMAANVNLDGGNIWGPTEDVVFIGYGKSSLDGVVEKWAGEQGRTVEPDQFPDRGFFYRSDQFNLAKIGVPAIYLDTGTDFVGQPEGWGREQIEEWEGEHYHQQSDELEESWEWGGMIQDARLYLFVGVEIAEADEMPQWNPGDEFEDDRMAALDALPGQSDPGQSAE